MSGIGTSVSRCIYSDVSLSKSVGGVGGGIIGSIGADVSGGVSARVGSGIGASIGARVGGSIGARVGGGVSGGINLSKIFVWSVVNNIMSLGFPWLSSLRINWFVKFLSQSNIGSHIRSSIC